MSFLSNNYFAYLKKFQNYLNTATFKLNRNEQNMEKNTNLKNSDINKLNNI